MEENQIVTITYHPQEYLEVILEQSLPSQIHAFYLSSPFLLNGFLHLSDDRIFYFDTQNYVSLRHYLAHHTLSKDDLKQWAIFLLEKFENVNEGYFICQLDEVFIDEKSKQLMLCKVPYFKNERLFEQFSQFFNEVYEVMDYEGDDEWISQFYFILKTRPLRQEILRQFLYAKKNKQWFSFFKKEDDLSQFFKLMDIPEIPIEQANHTVPFETQVLMAGFQYGYLIDEHKQHLLISSSPWLIGRLNQCHHIVDYPEVSKIHCAIEVEEGACFLIDQQSTNGTLLNGQKLIPHQKYPLNDQDVFSLAGHLFTYYV